MPDSAAGLAAAIGHPAFRIGAPDEPPPDGHEVPVLETLTSGSMGRPRRIRRTQGSWTASFAVNARFGIGPGARVAVPGRLVHSLSLYGAVEGLHLGAEVHLLADLRPDRQRQALAERRITHLYATPAQLRLMLGPGALPDLQLILIGGSKLDSALRAGLAALAPGAELREFYGAAETSFVTLADAATPEASVGRPYPGVALRLDADGTIWVQSPYLFLGYAGEGGGEAGSGAAPSPLVGEGGGGGASAARWREGWLSVGEVGRLEEGFLTLRGRAGRMVTVADQNVFPEEIEDFLLGLPGVVRAAVLALPDSARGHRLVAVVQGDRAAEVAILAALRAELGPTRAPRAVVWREDWPVLASGKTDLRALEAALWPA
ncbi:AMP-binding protein [Tabrizicola flagellatus]|uniref:AMP-binding protein n=1 Tax=Tabrizicola flagellatus TaxID=2593021 RepID=UPI001359367A|nr:AMP-binding protein [Tabrizicola flagellatus]